MFEFKHPKFYKELRKRNKELQAATRDLAEAQSDQAISSKNRDGECERATGPGLKPQASSKTTLSKLIRKLNKENAPPGGW